MFPAAPSQITARPLVTTPPHDTTYPYDWSRKESSNAPCKSELSSSRARRETHTEALHWRNTAVGQQGGQRACTPQPQARTQRAATHHTSGGEVAPERRAREEEGVKAKQR